MLSSWTLQWTLALDRFISKPPVFLASMIRQRRWNIFPCGWWQSYHLALSWAQAILVWSLLAQVLKGSHASICDYVACSGSGQVKICNDLILYYQLVQLPSKKFIHIGVKAPACIGLRFSPLSCVSRRWQPIYFTATSWLFLGLAMKHAHWCTAQPMLGLAGWRLGIVVQIPNHGPLVKVVIKKLAMKVRM
jgi:hypothetical protein